MRSFDWKAGLGLALALMASAAAPEHASAQFFFRPFANVFRYPGPGEGPPAYASRPAVASILGRTGFQLVGPLGRRGDQIVATGVSRREGEMRFIIDPYEGRILRAVRLGQARRGAPDAPPIAGGPGPAGPGFDAARDPGPVPGGARLNGAPNGPAQPRAGVAKLGASSKTSRAIVPPKPVAEPAPQADRPASGASAPAKAAQDSPADAKSQTPPPASAEAASAPAPSQAAQETKPEVESAASPQTPAVAEKASDNAAVSAERSAPARRAAAARAALARRALTPPKDVSGTTIVTPAASAPPAPGANGSATAPDDARKPAAGG